MGRNVLTDKFNREHERKRIRSMKRKYVIRWMIKSKHINKYNKSECIYKIE